MILLDTTTRSLELVLNTAGTIPYLTSWVEIDTTTQGIADAGTEVGLSNGTTPVTIVAAPATDRLRQVKLVLVRNDSGSSKTVTIRYNDNGTIRSFSFILDDGDVLQYVDTEGWRAFTSSGQLKGTGGGGGGGAPTNASYVVLGLDATLTAERTLAGEASVVSITDGGANADVTVGLVADGVSNTKLANMAANTVKANATGATADPADLSIPSNTVLGRKGGNIVAETIVTAQVADDQITDAKLANAAANTVKGNPTASSADPQDISIPTNTVLGRKGGDIVAETIATAQVADDQITNAKLANVAANTVKGNPTASSADPQDVSIPTNTVLGRKGSNIVAETVDTAQITNDAVDNTKLANMAQSTVKGRAVGAGTGDPTDLTAAQATAILDVFTSGLKGLAPASGGGTTNFLRADGTWAAPSGGGGGAGQLELGFHGDAGSNVTLTNQANAEQFLANNNRNIKKADLSSYTQVRLLARVVTASASVNNPRLYVEYSTSFTTTVGSYLGIGSSAVNCSLAATGLIDSGWINLVAGALADVFITVLQNGGDAAADPALGHVVVQFK